MKQTIKIKMLNGKVAKPCIKEDSDWIDLRTAEDIRIEGPYTKQARKDTNRKTVFSTKVVPLGIAMQLPKGYEAIVNVRSSTYKNFNVVLANSQGVIDETYNGDNDQWFVHLIAFKDTRISLGDRICQFRIQLSQKATVWQKIKWLFSNGVRIKFVDNLNDIDRGGHGHSGIK